MSNVTFHLEVFRHQSDQHLPQPPVRQIVLETWVTRFREREKKTDVRRLSLQYTRASRQDRSCVQPWKTTTHVRYRVYVLMQIRTKRFVRTRGFGRECWHHRRFVVPCRGRFECEGRFEWESGFVRWEVGRLRAGAPSPENINKINKNTSSKIFLTLNEEFVCKNR